MKKLLPPCYLLALIGLFSCSRDKQEQQVEIQWESGRATGIAITQFHENKDAVEVALKKDSLQPAILGEATVENDRLIFKPLIPFTPGLEYSIRISGKPFYDFKIPENSERPELLGIYPSDTVPENILKLHLAFSQPMREGQSLDRIFLFNDNGDTLKGTFLYLKTELWNEDRTVITLWFDPGRVKRGLQPNEKMGSPLKNKKVYTLKIDSGWESAGGRKLSASITKKIYVSARDSLSPVTAKWKIKTPGNNSIDPVTLDFKETLDHNLIPVCFQVYDKDNREITGRIEALAGDRGVKFTPAHSWAAGNYRIKIETRLEDLAGNNLDRPFDRDVSKVGISGKEFFEISFKIPE